MQKVTYVSGTVLDAGAQWGADQPRGYSAAGKASVERVTTHIVCLVSTELEGLTENLPLPCEILRREKQFGHIHFYLVANINVWLYVKYFNNKRQTINYF